MRIVLFAALVGLVSAPALAQVKVEVSAPTITFKAPPPLVDIGNGVQVVPGINEEVFFVDQYYRKTFPDGACGSTMTSTGPSCTRSRSPARGDYVSSAE
jgi:hypothetical protein